MPKMKSPLGGKNQDRDKPVVQVMALILDRATQVEVQTRFNLFTEAAINDNPSLLGPKKGGEADAFAVALLSPVAIVGKNTITNFDPANKQTYVAIQWENENSGANRSIVAAQKEIDRIIGSKTLSDEEKAPARERQKNLAVLDGKGTLAIYPPNLGQSFRYTKEQELWQSVGATVPEAGIEAVRRQYENTEAWMKAPNGQPTNLTERQWLQVRPPEFKKWFGDWEGAIRAEQARELTPLDLTSIANLADKDAIKQHFSALGKVQNSTNKQIVTFPVKTAGKIYYHKGVPVTKIAGGIKEIFEQSIPAFSEPEILKAEHLEHNNFERYDHYIGKVKLGDIEYYVRFTVQVEKRGRKRKKTAPLRQEVHSLAISEIAIYENSEPNSLGKTTLRAESVPNFFDQKLFDFFEGVKPVYVSKIVDKNGEPLVVYHGTEEGATQSLTPTKGGLMGVI